MKFTLNRDKTVNSLFGHTIEFKKGVATHVPKEAWAEVTAVGAIPEEELPEEPVAKSAAPTNPAERQAVIFAAFEQIILKGERESFTGSGSPHNKVVSEFVGFTVDAKERDRLWVAFRQANKEE